MRLDGEETFFGESIDTREEFIEDLCERVNTGYSTMVEEDDKMNQLAFITTFLIAFKGKKTSLTIISLPRGVPS